MGERNMTPVEIEKNIFQEMRGLPAETLREILDFIQFLKTKHVQSTPKTEDMLANLPKHQLGKINSSLRREEIYTDAR